MYKGQQGDIKRISPTVENNPAGDNIEEETRWGRLQANEWPKKRMANFFSEWPNIKLRVLSEWPRPFT